MPNALLTELVEHRAQNPKLPGSSPGRGSGNFFPALESLKILGSLLYGEVTTAQYCIGLN